MKRRQLLKALGLGGLATLLGSTRRVKAELEAPPPTRVVFFVTAHGHTPSSWMLPIPDGSTSELAERPLAPMLVDELPPVLKPLHPFRDRLLVVEGLAHTANLVNLAEARDTGADNNNHSLAVAGLLTADRVKQQPGIPCTGGARSIDQVLASRTAAPGRFGSRVYGFDYIPNLTVAPFSFLGSGQPTPYIKDPQVAYEDLLGIYIPPPSNDPLDRAHVVQAMRPSVLDSVAREYELMAPRLDGAGRARLDAHRQLVRDLEASLGAGPSAVCDTTFDPAGHKVTQFSRVIKMAFSCDLTRVATFVVPVPQCPEFGYPADQQVHFHEHRSIPGGSGCGAMYDPYAEQAIVDLGIYYANHFAYLLEQLDSVVEGNGTMLDNTIVVWVTELATGTHLHHDTFTIIAGGGNAGFNSGRYVRYPRTITSPVLDTPSIGPATNHLYVNILQAMGQPDTTFGLASVVDAAGGTISLEGPLTELTT